MSKQLLTAQRMRWQRFNTRTQAFWQTLSIREQRMVLGTATVLGTLLVWLLLIQPPLKKIDYWQVETPKLRTQTQTLQTLLQEVSPISAPVEAANLESALRQTLENAGLGGHYQLEVSSDTAPHGWALTFDSAPADAVVAVLLGRLGPLSLDVIEARLHRVGSADTSETAGRLSGIVRMTQTPGAKEAS
ncbi:type II secretion system protein GspM [Pseudomonas sp. NPDC089734]|uniref:type II secretion system protein GspM n=1 Tax=Pseudomonas sp. NPDC089734 TaxID=3364469 RepID=UPI003824D2DF